MIYTYMYLNTDIYHIYISFIHLYTHTITSSFKPLHVGTLSKHPFVDRVFVTSQSGIISANLSAMMLAAFMHVSDVLKSDLYLVAYVSR